MIFKKNKNSKIIDEPKEEKPQHSLVLPLNYDSNPNYKFIRDNLLNSGLFSKIDYKELPTNRHQQTIIVDNISCLIDAADNPNINGTISSGILKNVKFVFILQYCSSMQSSYLALSKELGISILPLIYGACGWFPLSGFSWRNKDHKYLANFNFVTRHRPHRNAWVNKAEQNKKFMMDFKKGQEYVECLKECKWGVSLQGYGRKHDGKCYRETEFLSFGMPLALTYRPYYAFPFLAGIHYLYLESTDMLDKLETIDPIPFAKRSKEIWDNYYSPVGFTNLLFSIIYDEKYRNSILNLHTSNPKIDIKLDRIRCKK